MDVFLSLLLLLCLFGAKIASKDKLYNEAGLDKDHTNAIRGFLCILIILDHSSLLTGCGYSVGVLKRVGPYVVALFYLFSGYGLLSSYKISGYSLKGFWRKRLLNTVLPYLLFTIVAVIIRLAFKEQLSIKDMLLSFVNGHPMVLYSWFIITIIVFYTVFYFSALIAKKDILLLTSLIGFAMFCFVFVMQKLGFDEFWFNTAWAFPLGIIWYQIHPKVSKAFKSHPWIYLGITGFSALWWIVIAEHFFWFGYLARLCSSLAVSIFIMLLMFKLKIGNPILSFLGRISLYIYLMHGLLVTLLTPLLPPTEHPYLFVFVLLSGSILFAWLFHLLFGKLQIKVVKKRS